jgi:hypothetical protein
MLAKNTDDISLVDFTWIFTDPDLPGVQSRHSGIINVSAAGLKEGASSAGILSAVDDASATFLEQVLSVNASQLAFLFDMANADEVTVRAITTEEVDAEADRRIAAGFTFEGVLYQAREKDRENIAGAKSAATDAIALGAQAENYGWRKLLDPNGPAVFAWIAADNSLVPMDAQTVVRFGYAALALKEAHIFAARTIKNMPTIPADYATNAAYWP